MAGEHVSADDIIGHFAAIGEPIGRATVYRYLGTLERDGFIQRYVTGTHKASCFQYIDAPEEVSRHFHLQCERCGTLLHVECHTLSDMERHIRQSHGFDIDPLRTVLYGVCHDCGQPEMKGSDL
jgi:Fur family ferric uptake transcriptional regulator